MPKESNLITKIDITLNDFLRIVSEEGESRKSSVATLKQLIEEGTATPYIQVVTEGDDKGLIVTEQLSVGTSDNPKESIFGGGDSYPVGTEHLLPTDPPDLGSAWHATIANTTGLVITGATDITDTLASDEGSVTGLFEGTAAGNYILIGSENRFPGVKVKVVDAGIIEPDDIQGEFLPGDGSGWLPVQYMVTKALWPYTHRADNIATVSNQSEQWHFGFNPFIERTLWLPTTLNINGVDYTKYWARMRITSDIAGDPNIEQMKLHTDRMEINPDGTSEYYGLGVYPVTLLAGVGHLINNAAGSPAGQDVTYETGECIADYNDNQFNNNADDSAIMIQNIVQGLHTGVPLVLSISYYVEGTATGDVEWRAQVYEISDGFIYDGNAIPEIYNVIDTVDVPSNLVRRTAYIAIPIHHLSYMDAIVLMLRRDARSVNPLDTLPDDCVVTNVRLTGYFWKP